jgi:ribosomal protein S27AE
MSDKQVSDFSLERKECPVCGAIWLNGQHRWSTGKVGDEETLSNLVCGIKNDPQCINSKHKKGHIYGDKDTWEKRRKLIDQKMKEIDDA